jgi:GH18 family chitinase
MVAKKSIRSKFIKRLVKLCKKHRLHGVDYNWEYPKDAKEWAGLFKLIVETRAAFALSHDPTMVISMAYYPDTRQEALLAAATDAVDALDYMHMMSYDQPKEHSTWEFGKQAVEQGVKVLPPAKLTMGLPFYSRDVRTGDWATYEDIVKIHAGGTLDPDIDQLGDRYFNGAAMIRRKTACVLFSQCCPLIRVLSMCTLRCCGDPGCFSGTKIDALVLLLVDHTHPYPVGTDVGTQRRWGLAV